MTSNCLIYDIDVGIYLVRPASSGYTQISGKTINYLTGLTGSSSYIPTSISYIRQFEVIATPNDLDLFFAGYSNNVYGDKTYSFQFKKDFDVSDYFDALGFPLTELYLYLRYRTTTNGDGDPETMFQTIWTGLSGESQPNTIRYESYEIGDLVYGDKIEFSKNSFFQYEGESQQYYIFTPYNNRTKFLGWKYNPFIPIRLRYFVNEISTAKLPEVAAATTSLNVSFSSDETQNFSVSKSSNQVMTENQEPIKKWNDGVAYTGNTRYSWDKENGELTFLTAGLYNITFETTLFLSQNTKYDGQTYLQKGIGSSFSNILNTKRDYYNNQQDFRTKRTVTISQFFNINDKLRTTVERTINGAITEDTVIPNYAIPLDESGTFIWRDIQKQGIVDPLTGNGVDYPFVNGRRYLFSNIVFDVIPNLDDNNTRDVFLDIRFGVPETINYSPRGDIDDIGKPC
jgi:hypothetical protein